MEGFQILWKMDLLFATREWWRDPDFVAKVASTIAASALWNEVEVIGQDFERGRPRGDAMNLAATLEKGRGFYNLTRGGPQSAVLVDESDVLVQIGVATGKLGLNIHVAGEVLARLGPSIVDDVIALAMRLRSTLDARLECLHGRPNGRLGLVYDRPMPKRRADWPLSAVIDVVEIEPPANARPSLVAAASAIAMNALPESVVSRTHDGVLECRWVSDPRDVDAMLDAAIRHERWLTPLIDTELV